MARFTQAAAGASTGSTRPSRAHGAHMAVLAIHTLCCGAPFALVLFGAGANAGLLGAQVTIAHGMMHHFELWVLAVSLGLVVLGGALEWRRRKERAFPVLFVLSIACLALNASIVFGHSGPIDAKGLELFSWAHAAHGSN